MHVCRVGGTKGGEQYSQVFYEIAFYFLLLWLLCNLSVWYVKIASPLLGPVTNTTWNSSFHGPQEIVVSPLFFESTCKLY